MPELQWQFRMPPRAAGQSPGKVSGIHKTRALRRHLIILATQFSIYIVLCSDDTYYTGIAADVDKRMVEHASGPRGAKYLRGRGPLTLVYSEIVGDRATALRLEYRVKQLDRAQKKALIDGSESLQVLAANQLSAAG